jgi:hypothetical protein
LASTIQADPHAETLQKAVAETEGILQKSCGPKCVEVLHALMASPRPRNLTHVSSEQALESLSDRVLQQAADAERARDTFLKSASLTSSGSKASSKVRQPMMLNMKMILAGESICG